jgi:outer membrane protein assembly factor BamB
MKAQHQQVEVDRSQTLTEFIKEDKINLTRDVHYDLTDITDMAVTSDNKLLLCNYYDDKVYIYKDYKTYEDEISLTSPPWCITVVPCTDKAVVILPDERSIQFINTTNNTKDNKINIGERCVGGVTAVKDKIYIGGYNKVIILNIDGSLVRKIATTNRGFNYNLLYNERNDQLLLRQEGRLCCINLDGHVIYRYDISGDRGLAVDQQGHVYISGADDIHRLSPDGTFRDIVLSKHDGVDRPSSITFNNDFTKLFIIINGGKTVLVYSCK